MFRKTATVASSTLSHASFRRFSLSPLLQRIAEIRAARRQRIALATMEDHRLCDLGLSREQASIEAARPIWDVPASWRM